MANSLEFAKKFLPIIDDIYKAQAVTEGMDSGIKVDFTGTPEVKVLKVSTTGLGDYSRENGYPKGDLTAAWETLTLTTERGKEISIDRMDDEETLGLVFGTVVGNFMRDFVAPELDAYRFARYSSTEGITKVSASLTKNDILEAFDEAERSMTASEVPENSRILYVNSNLKPVLNQAVTRRWGSEGSISNTLEGYNGTKIVYVPSTRFYTGINLAAGKSSWGYAKTEEAKDINFMLIYPGAIIQAKKFALPKIFTPDENQDKDAWKFQFRMYHDCFAYENKKSGIYVNTK